MNPRRRNRQIAKTAKYTVPLDEHASEKAGRFKRRSGALKKGYKVVGGDSTSGRIPFSTVAVPQRLKKRRRAVGSITPSGRGLTKIY